MLYVTLEVQRAYNHEALLVQVAGAFGFGAFGSVLSGPGSRAANARAGCPGRALYDLKIRHENPTSRQLRNLAKPHGVVTEYGSLAFSTTIKRRWATRTVQDGQVTRADRQALRRAIKSLAGQQLVETYGKLGKGKDAALVRVIVPEKYSADHRLLRHPLPAGDQA